MRVRRGIEDAAPYKRADCPRYENRLEIAMLLRNIKIGLVAVFALAAIAFGGFQIYQYTHEDISPPAFYGGEEPLVVSVKASDRELCAGLYAQDNMDGDLTDKIQVQRVSQLISSKEATVTYLVFDSASNYATFTRTVTYTDYHRPRFSLAKPLIFQTGGIMVLDNLSAEDVLDGDISNRITFTRSNVLNSTPGTYQVVVQVTNSAGDTSSLPLSVIVYSNLNVIPTINLSSYLLYVDAGDKVDFKSMVRSVQDPLDDSTISRSAVQCHDEHVDLNAPGIYEVYYYYTGRSGETATTILTVVVE